MIEDFIKDIPYSKIDFQSMWGGIIVGIAIGWLLFRNKS